MQPVVLDEPYVPVPPHRGRLWPAMLTPVVPFILRRSYGVTRVECVHAERLRASLAAGHGIVLAPNHCRDEDPLVLGALSRAAGSPFFTIASWHVFKLNKLNAFLLPRAGAFSIYREGTDRGAINTAVDILEKAERPLVIFPEGHISRTNDRLGALMEGVTLIARTAAKKRAKLATPGKVVAHPVAIRYVFQGDAESAAAQVLDEIEARLTWPPRRGVPVRERIAKVGGALLTLKELEYLGAPQSGDLGQRLVSLTNAVLNPREDEWCGGKHDGSVNARVKRLRTAILPDLVKGELPETERARRWQHLADAYLAQQLFHYPPDYLDGDVPPTRLIETVERFEEDLTDRARKHGDIVATITVGDAVEVAPERGARGGDDPLLTEIERQLRAMLGLPAAIVEPDNVA
jgi:1-acyl-sn-glycerol-3-phosphate acyltransferase